MNEWVTKEVFQSHEYHKNVEESCKHHEEFAMFLSGESPCGKRKYENASILDIGCCNGRVLNSLLKKNIRKYHGIDLNPHAIEVAKEHWKEQNNVSFDVFDVEEQDLRSLNLEQFDVAYLDSTITYFRNYKEILETLLESVDTVFCDRTLWITNIYLDCADSKLKELSSETEFEFESVWSGMKEASRRVFLNEAYVLETADAFDKRVTLYKEDMYDGNWYDFYAYTEGKNDKLNLMSSHVPVITQQKIREEKSLGDIVRNRFLQACSKGDMNGMDTGRGVWFKLPDSNEIYHGGDVCEDWNTYRQCSLDKTTNRKLIFASRSS